MRGLLVGVVVGLYALGGVAAAEPTDPDPTPAATATAEPTEAPAGTPAPAPDPDPDPEIAQIVPNLAALVFPQPTPQPVLAVMRPDMTFVQPRLRVTPTHDVRVRLSCVVATPGRIVPQNCTGSMRLFANFGGHGVAIGREGFDVPRNGGIVRLRLSRRGSAASRRAALPVVVRVIVTNADADSASGIALASVQPHR